MSKPSDPSSRRSQPIRNRINLRMLPLFAEATDDQTAELIDAAEVVWAASGERLFPDFSVTDAFWILIEGRWRVTRRVAGVAQLMFEADRPGTWTGGIPIIDAIAPPKAEILEKARLLKIRIAVLPGVPCANPQIAKRLLEAMNWGSGYIGGLLPT